MSSYQGTGAKAGGLWPDPIDGPFYLSLDLYLIDGRAEIVGLRLQGYDPSKTEIPEIVIHGWGDNEDPFPIRTTDIRNLKLHELLRAKIPEQVEGWDRMIENARSDIERQVLEAGRSEWAESKPRRGGRPALTNEDHTETARIYKKSLVAGVDPTMAVASQLTLSHSGAAKRVTKARKAGFLKPTMKGKAGG